MMIHTLHPSVSNSVFVLVLLVMLWASCSVQKRRYRKGYRIAPAALHLRQKTPPTLPAAAGRPLLCKTSKVVDAFAKGKPRSPQSALPARGVPVPPTAGTLPVAPAQAIPREGTTKQSAKTARPARVRRQFSLPPAPAAPNHTPKQLAQRQRTAALLIGISLLLMATLAALTVPALSRLFVAGNPAQTALNVRQHVNLYRGGLIGWLGILVLDVLVSWGIYRYYKNEQPKLAGLTAALRLLYSLVLSVAIVSLAKVGSASGADKLYYHFAAFQRFWGLGLIVFGFHLIALGALFKRENGKKWVNVLLRLLLITAGVGYVVQYVGLLLVPNPIAFAASVETIFLLPMICGELFYAMWKLLRGGKKEASN